MMGGALFNSLLLSYLDLFPRHPTNQAAVLKSHSSTKLIRVASLPESLKEVLRSNLEPSEAIVKPQQAATFNSFDLFFSFLKRLGILLSHNVS